MISYQYHNRFSNFSSVIKFYDCNLPLNTIRYSGQQVSQFYKYLLRLISGLNRAVLIYEVYSTKYEITVITNLRLLLFCLPPDGTQ